MTWRSPPFMKSPDDTPRPTLLVLSYEFTYSPFSGNGVLARSLVKGLLACGHRVHVLCCRPAPARAGDDLPIAAPEVSQEHASALVVHGIELSPEASWRRLDQQSAWKEFADGARAKASELLPKIQGSSVIAVDWSGGAAWRAMREFSPSGLTAPRPACLYINFRVYASGLNVADASAAWYDAQERSVLEAADHALALSARDQAALRSLRAAAASPPEVEILRPCLRGDLEALARRDAAETHAAHLPPAAAAALAASAAAGAAAVGREASGRRFVGCLVRASAEKNPQLVAKLLEETNLAAELSSRGLVLLVSCCGPTGVELARRVRAAAPEAAVLESFLGAEALAAVFSATVLNLHPCLYDAYGMSVVEAAAFGAPSVVNQGDCVGAAALLGPDGCLELDLAAPLHEVAGALLGWLDDAAALAQRAHHARERALSWGEEAAGRQLSATIERMLAQQRSAVKAPGSAACA